MCVSLHGTDSDNNSASVHTTTSACVLVLLLHVRKAWRLSAAVPTMRRRRFGRQLHSRSLWVPQLFQRLPHGLL